MKRIVISRLAAALCTIGVLGVSTQANASGFQLFEQDGGSYLANYHAGYAAAATDATTAFYNPAGIVRFKNQQAVIAGINFVTDFKYRGIVAVNTLNDGAPMTVTQQGGTYSFVPAFSYVAPITDCIGFGFSINAPFGLKTNYGNSSPLRYAATLTSVEVIDVSPSLGFQVMDGLSLGVGFDIQRMFAEFDSIAVVTDPITDTRSINKANDTAYGYHLGAIYAFTPCARLGLSYHSQVVHHLNGNSHFEGPLADVDRFFETGGGGEIASHASTKVTLPPYTMLSGYFRINDPFAVMATVGFTQWSTLRTLHIDSVAGINLLAEPITNIQVIVPEHYRNTWNASIGGEYHANDCITLRAGIGYDQSPLRDEFRDVRLPDNDRYVVAFGGHFQASKCVGVDLGWLHVFVNEDTVNPPPAILGSEEVFTNGKGSGGADVYGAQITWDIT